MKENLSFLLNSCKNLNWPQIGIGRSDLKKLESAKKIAIGASVVIGYLNEGTSCLFLFLYHLLTVFAGLNWLTERAKMCQLPKRQT